MNPEEKADRWTDLQMKRLENRLKRLYGQAHSDLSDMVDKYYNGWDEPVTDPITQEVEMVHHAGLYERYAEQMHAFENGDWTDELGNVVTDQKTFDEWWYAQEKRGEHWTDLRDQMADRLTHANEVAAAYINDQLPPVYAKSSNGIASIVQKSAIDKGIVGIRFDLVDEATVKSLVTESRQVFPFHLVKIDPAVDTPWNKQKLENALLQGILQGDSIPHIADRFQAVENMNRASAIRNARTAVTAAQSGGKQDRYKDLQSQGCEITKVWNDVHDAVPPERQAHWEAHHQEVPIDEPFIVGGEKLMHPGDTSLGASGWNIYNCRCTMKTGKIRFHSVLDPEVKRAANIRIYRKASS